MNSNARGKRAGSEEPNLRGKRTRITATDHLNKEGDVLQSLRAFRATVWSYWKENGRHDLAWRKTRDPYKILVSEVMLQQTQVSRVKEKYREFLKTFPNVQTLARSNLTDVLRAWSGMGYNRRAKFLRDAAKVIVEKYDGKVPRDFAALRALPGVGPYTASAVRVFAFNQSDTLIETNIRSAFIHHFFANTLEVRDRAILVYAQKAAKGNPPAGGPREWNWALMDYGAHIKKLHKNPSRQSVQYVKQSKFEGSLRQARGAILRELYIGPTSVNELLKKTRRSVLRISAERLDAGLLGLERDRLIEKKKGKWEIT